MLSVYGGKQRKNRQKTRILNCFRRQTRTKQWWWNGRDERQQVAVCGSSCEPDECRRAGGHWCLPKFFFFPEILPKNFRQISRGEGSGAVGGRSFECRVRDSRALNFFVGNFFLFPATIPKRAETMRAPHVTDHRQWVIMLSIFMAVQVRRFRGWRKKNNNHKKKNFRYRR